MNMRKKIGLGVLIFAMISAGICSQQAYGMTNSKEQEIAEQEAAQAEAEAAKALLTAESSLTEVDAEKVAVASGVGITSQIKSFIGKIVNQFKSAFNKAKSAMSAAFTKMKNASQKATALFKAQIINLQGQLKTLKDKATIIGKKLSAVMGAIIKVVPIAIDTFDSKNMQKLNKVKKTIAEAEELKADPNMIKTKDAKIETAKAFFDTAENMNAFLAAISTIFTAGVPDSWKEQADNSANLQAVLNWMGLYKQHMNATKAILNAKEEVPVEKKEEPKQEEAPVMQKEEGVISEEAAVLEAEAPQENVIEQEAVKKEPSLVEQRVAEWEEKIAAESKTRE